MITEKMTMMKNLTVGHHFFSSVHFFEEPDSSGPQLPETALSRIEKCTLEVPHLEGGLVSYFKRLVVQDAGHLLSSALWAKSLVFWDRFGGTFWNMHR